MRSIGGSSARVAVSLVIAALAACGRGPSSVGTSGAADRASSASPSSRVHVTGVFVKLTNLPCHRSDPYVGDKTVVFRGSDGSRTTVVTHSANWIGLPADPPIASLGQCRQVAPFEVDLPAAERYVVAIDGGRLPPVTLAELRAEGFRHRFLLPSPEGRAEVRG